MRILFTLLLSSMVYLAPAVGAYEVKTSARVVAFADVHGAYDALVTTLQNAGIVDDKLAWSGGAAHLVSIFVVQKDPRLRKHRRRPCANDGLSGQIWCPQSLWMRPAEDQSDLHDFDSCRNGGELPSLAWTDQ